jgi:pimeloyl-ACP methyl ester carboxylesterase
MSPAASLPALSVNGRKVPCLDRGSGSPVLYLHSFEGPLSDAAFVDRLAASRRLLAPVHPGFAGTEGSPDLHDIINVVAFYEDVLDAAGIEQADVIGHSLGGMFAAELAALSGRVRRLVLVAPLGLWLDEAPVPDVLASGGNSLARMLWADPAGEAATTAGRMSGIERTANLAASTHYVWPLPDRGLAARLHRLTMPTLLVRGEADGVISDAYLRAFAQRLPGASVRTIAGAGHFPMLEQPQALCEAVEAFLAS